MILSSTFLSFNDGARRGPGAQWSYGPSPRALGVRSCPPQYSSMLFSARTTDFFTINYHNKQAIPRASWRPDVPALLRYLPPHALFRLTASPCTAPASPPSPSLSSPSNLPGILEKEASSCSYYAAQATKTRVRNPRLDEKGRGERWEGGGVQAGGKITLDL